MAVGDFGLRLVRGSRTAGELAGHRVKLGPASFSFWRRLAVLISGGAALAVCGWSATEVTSSARFSVGWRDNVMLSPFDPVARSLVRGEVESMVLRGWGSRFMLVGFVNGDVTRYVSPPPDTGGEQQWYAQGEARWTPAPSTSVALKTAGFYQDAVIDLSETQNTRLVAPTHALGGTATALIRWQLPAGFAFEPSFQGRRTTYRDYAGDYDESRAGLRLEWRPSTKAWSLGLTWAQIGRPYDTRPRYTAGGRALSGTHLRLEQTIQEIRVERIGEWRPGRWKLAATLGRLTNRDGGSGYFDYDQRRARLLGEVSRGPWHLSVEGEARRTEYLVQTSGTGLTPPPRVADGFDTTARVARDFGRSRQVFLEHRWERSRSNEEQFSYRANTMLAGVQLGF
jgi:hypothetical protein